MDSKLIDQLLESGLDHSVQIWAQHLLSSTETPEPPHVLIACAKSFQHSNDHRRAIAYFEKAILELQRRPSSANENFFAQTLTCLAKSYQATKQFKQAMQTIENVPPRLRTIELYLLKAQLARQSGEKVAAIGAYIEILNRQPFAIESAISLLQLGVPLNEVIVGMNEAIAKVPLLLTILKAYSRYYLQDYAGAAFEFEGLCRQNPSVFHLQLQLALSYTKLIQFPKAALAFAKARSLDPQCVTGMDSYVQVLLNLNKNLEATRLADELMLIDNNRPQPWIALARSLEGKNVERAIFFIDKAIDTDGLYAGSYVCKGDLLSVESRHTEAISMYHKAYSLQPDVDAIYGLVMGYSALGKLQDAFFFAKIAVDSAPLSPRALTMIGVVFARDPKKKDRARKALDKALLVDPSCTEALLGIVSLEISGDNIAEAINLLEKYAQSHPSDVIHTRLGDVFTLKKQYQEAIVHYNIAINFNPNFARAREGLVRVEKLINNGVEEPEDAQPEDEEDFPA